MTSSSCGSLAIALVLGLACTGSNPAFDPDAGASDDAADDKGASTDAIDTTDASGSDEKGSTRGPTDDTGTTLDTTGRDPTDGGVCSASQRIPPAIAQSRDAQRCPSEGFIRGPLVELSSESFAVTDCGDCSACNELAPTWSITVPGPLVPKTLQLGECVDVLFDCDVGAFTELRNLVLFRGSSTPALVIAAPALPQIVGAWAPTMQKGAACSTPACADSYEMDLHFLDATFSEGEGGRTHILIGDDMIEMDVFVGNAHYDHETCEEIIFWVGRPG